jgi:hypothetical protein
MKNSIIIILTAFILPSFSSTGNIQMQMEIDHLMGYIQSTECIFIRNGKDYGPDEAIEHIKRKYEYFQNRIDSTEKFIELCATKSTMSNNPYLINCREEEVVECGVWLLGELQRFRLKYEKSCL